MKYSVSNIYKCITLLSLVILLNSCGLKPIPSEYAVAKNNIEKVDINSLGKGTILIYNGADFLHTMDNTARLNIWIDDKPLGQIKLKEYVILKLDSKIYEFKALHKDVFNMKSAHTVSINNDTKVIMIKPTITSNKLKVTNELPKNFIKYEYALFEKK